MDTIRKIVNLFMHDHVSGNARADFEAWIISPKDQDLKTDALKEEWHRLEQQCQNAPVSLKERKERLSDIHERIGKERSKRKGIFMPWWSVAASLTLLAALAAAFSPLSSRMNDKVTTCMVAPVMGKGEFILPDSTHIWLNSGSRIEYDEDFMSAGIRQVRLDGEAFFDVVKSDRPFVVDMGGIAVKVLGTRFNARNTSHYDDYQVTLAEGAVMISGETFQDISLKPGQQFSCTSDLRAPSIRRVNTMYYSSWTKSSLEFDDMALEDIITHLEHWYNVRFVLGQGVNKNEHISFKMRTETLEESLGLIGKLAGLECNVDEDGVVTMRRR